MTNKKAQGLPLTTIAIAILVILTLVVVALFVTGGFSRVFGAGAKVTSGGAGSVDADRAACQSFCTQALQSPTAAIFKNSGYCKKVLKADLNKDNKIDGTVTGGVTENNFRCWDAPVEYPVGIDCTGTLPNQNGDVVSKADC
ncbi:MAG: hypothetical protein HYT16_01875 [DPANN group archaeon]|nr:hypothetical protein [DPANN group archaeon]